MEIVELSVVVDNPRQGDFEDTGFLQDHNKRDIQKIEAQALRGWKNNFSVGVMGTFGPREKSPLINRVPV